MTIASRQFFRLTLLAIGLLGSALSPAQQQRWYKVELLIFSHLSQAAARSEQWQATPALSYPDKGRFLLDTQAIERNLGGLDGTSEVDALGYQTITITAEPESEQGATPPAAAQVNPRQQGISSATKPSPETPAVTPPTTTPTPFTLLPSSELEFRGKAAYMQRTGRYRTLFHQSWVQPMVDSQQAIPIIVDHSGDSQQWPQLQGSVKFYLTRYLHLETNLWLNTDGSYLPSDWQMPPAPLGPNSLTIIYPPEPEPDPATVAPAGNELVSIDSMMDESDSEFFELEPQGPVYPWRHAVLLKEERRMRSSEVHYIDHPMLGVVVKISPLDDNELQRRATAEADANQGAPQDSK